MIDSNSFNNAMSGVAIDLRNALLDTVPVRTGRLKTSIEVKNKGNATIEISMVDYGKFVEFGTSRQRPNPFIRTVLYNKLPLIVKENLMRHLK